MNLKTLLIEKNANIKRELCLLVLFILAGISGRTLLVGWQLQPFPNFEIIMVLTFLAAIFIRPTFAFLVPLFSMIGSDILIGNPILIGSQMNKIILFTYTGFLIIALFSVMLRKTNTSKLERLTGKNMISLLGIGIGFVILYDLWTNFGWWYLMFPHTIETLSSVYIAGIPFMIYHILSAVCTITFIVIPIGYILYHKTHQPIIALYPKWEKIPIMAFTLLFISISLSGSAMKLPTQTEIWLEESDETSVHISINGKNWILQDRIFVQDDISVYTALERVASRHNLDIKASYNEQFQSILIESIHIDVNGDDNQYWYYYVNNEAPMIGCDMFMVSNGDSIKWIYE